MVYLHKGRISTGTYSKLKNKKYRSYCILEKINGNAYIVNLPKDMVISSTFNVADIFAYYPRDEARSKPNLRASSF